jgi:hypothetical protein
VGSRAGLDMVMKRKTSVAYKKEFISKFVKAES